MGTSQPDGSGIQQDLKLAKIIWVIMAFGFPSFCIYFYLSAVLHGNVVLFFKGYDKIPWSDPFVLILLGLSVLECIASAYLPSFAVKFLKYLNATPNQKRRAKILLALALLDAVAMYGLVLGFTIGPKMAPLSLCLLLAPIVGGFLLAPNEQSWREADSKMRL